MQIQPLHRVTSTTVRQLAHAAAENDECLDAANVFPIGTDQHAVFTSEYLARMAELEGFDATGGGAEFTDLDIVVLFDEEVA